jgi:hypothetical protein
MRRLLPALILLCIAGVSGARQLFPCMRSLAVPLRKEQGSDLPRRQAPVVRADTTWYGGYQVIGGEYYARSGSFKPTVAWTFDRGDGPHGVPGRIENGEGWTAEDLTENHETFFRVIDASLDLGAGVAAPVLSGARSLWVGLDRTQTRALCWTGEAGYGNHWGQTATTEPLPFDGSGSVTLSFRYFNDSEECFDGTQVYLLREGGARVLLNPYPGACAEHEQYAGGFTGKIGIDAGGIITPALYTRVLSPAEIGVAQAIRFQIEFRSDGAYSDEDGLYTTRKGPFAFDDVVISGGGCDRTYDFETGLQGWTPGVSDPIGAFTAIVDVGGYVILDPCACKLSGNVLAFHDPLLSHPTGQYVRIESPICDSGNTDAKTIFMEFDMYSELPRDAGVLFRPGWRYYPWTCDLTGATGWSPRVGMNAFNYTGTDPICATWRYGGTSLGTAGTPVPATARMVKALIELQSDCAAFSIDPCGGITNFTPLIDNIAVGMLPAVHAPTIAFDLGASFQDTGSYPSNLFDVRAPGPANTRLATNYGDLGGPYTAGDSLVVTGPLPEAADPNTRWEARLWWRIARRAPFNADKENGVTSRYKIWRDKVADGRAIDRAYRPEFTSGWMDSTQLGPAVHKNKFLSSFRENDDDFVAEGSPENEMIWDDVLYPGTRIEYFVTSNYVNTAGELFYLPDTTGGAFFEFEVLPGVRVANVPGCGQQGFNYCAYQPAVLYLDVSNAGQQTVIENALRTVLNGLAPCTDPFGCTIPVDRNWDRYDYESAAGCYNVPFGRGSYAACNYGMALKQILGYRTILCNTATLGMGATEEEDWALLTDWATTAECQGNVNRQVFIMNGDRTAEVLMGRPGYGVPFLQNILGAGLVCESFNGLFTDGACPPVNDSYCVRLLPTAAAVFGTGVDVDAFGNACPNVYSLNVLAPLGGAVANRRYFAEDGLKELAAAQVVQEHVNIANNLRTVIDGVSWDHMTARNAGGSGFDVCPRDLPSVVAAAIDEIGGALRWGFEVPDNGSIPILTLAKTLATCQGTWNLPSDIDSDGPSMVTRLEPARPNPFSERAEIRYSLARAGAVKITIYDVSGREVRRLVDKPFVAGNHVAVWDGTDNDGHRVASGIYWMQMKAGEFVSNRRLLTLR